MFSLHEKNDVLTFSFLYIVVHHLFHARELDKAIRNAAKQRNGKRYFIKSQALCLRFEKEYISFIDLKNTF